MSAEGGEIWRFQTFEEIKTLFRREILVRDENPLLNQNGGIEKSPI